MAGSDTLTQQLWTAVKARLDSSALFVSAPAIEALRRGHGDPDSELQEALGAAGRAGLAVALTEPILNLTAPMDSLGVIRFQVAIAEVPQLNRGVGGTGKQIARVHDDVIDRLHGWTGHELPLGAIHFTGAPSIPDEGGGMIRALDFICGVMVAVSS